MGMELTTVVLMIIIYRKHNLYMKIITLKVKISDQDKNLEMMN